jgi:hypothetical protein
MQYSFRYDIKKDFLGKFLDMGFTPTAFSMYLPDLKNVDVRASPAVLSM